MKTRAVVYVGSLRLSAVAILAAVFLCADTWAGRVSQEPRLTTARTPLSASSARGEYRLVFPAGYEVPIKPTGPGRDSSRDSKFDNFVERLNEAGSEGYRLTSFVYKATDLPVGLVKRAGASYEYRWFSTDGRVYGSQVTADFDKQYPTLAQQGFRLAAYSVFEDYCEYHPPYDQPGPIPTTCHDAYVFLFEREKGVAHPARYAVAQLYGSSDDTLLTAVKRLLADGMIPTISLTPYKIWFEPASAGDGRWGGGAEVEAVTQAYDAGKWWPSSAFEKRFDELARRGFRVGMLDWGVALMYRARGVDAAGYSYEWVKADGGLERRLSQLQARGAVYLKIYKDHRADRLIFEQRAVDDGTRYEYKVLKFKFGKAKAKDTSGARVRVELAPSSKEALERDVGEGFAVRDLFLSGGQVGAILERLL